MSYINREETVSSITKAAAKNPNITISDVLELIQKQQDAEIPELKLATGILDTAISELYEAAEDWYRGELLENLGTSKEELASLGIKV